MTSPKAIISIAIIAIVFFIAAWSKLRLLGHKGYDASQRWRIDAFPLLDQDAGDGGSAR
ncbi:MAG: hypothetical protein WCA32_20065 [Chromatiaceae bacterium]|jgi:hypothetical protein